MEKGKPQKAVNAIKPARKPSQSSLLPISSTPSRKKTQIPSLVSLCIGFIGRHFDDIIEDLTEIASSFPPSIKIALAAVARRRKLLDDDVILALADSSWEILDISGSDVSDFGLSEVVKTCKYLKAVDISWCSKVTWTGVSELLHHSQSLEILRWGGCSRSEDTARRCLCMLKPSLKDVEGESWEEVDASELAHGAHLLRWLVWPKIGNDSMEHLQVECPRIIVNPKNTLFTFRGLEVPREALPDVSLDDQVVEDIEPKTWELSPRTSFTLVPSQPDELPIAEKFRLAYLERDNRLAPKRAKNARQRQHRAEREWVMMSTNAKALALASQATKSLHIRS
ncbi:unnamed protein product [Cuscuta campestris]|uniref:RNI-like superfamily protein n=1 Tax=Cuscuta campestris TaxID=132261 RepID=A0A484K5T5_9ASTE|nr:unnamed protein product [Cuscuta campestris]